MEAAVVAATGRLLSAGLPLIRLIKFLTEQGLVLPSYKQPQGELACLRWQEGVNTAPDGLRLVRQERNFPPWESLVLPHEMDGGGHGF